MQYGLANKATGHLGYYGIEDDMDQLVSLADTINNSSTGGVEIVQFQYLMMCAWCKPLNHLAGSHGICRTHRAEVQLELDQIKAQKELVSLSS